MLGQYPVDLTGELQNLAKCDLVADVARQFGEVRLKVTGTSMLPSVWPGDILTVRRRSVAELLPGQIVLCYRNQGFVAHRLVGKLGDCLVTRGDSLSNEDRPFQNDEVLGEVVSILRNGRRVAPSPLWLIRAGSWILRHSELCTRMLLRLRSLRNLSWAR
jgi:signal peptidase I